MASAVLVWSISYNDLKEMCPNEVAAIENHPEFTNWGDLVKDVRVFKDDALPRLIHNLKNNFKKVNTVNNESLSLFLTYYDETKGDGHDSVEHTDGCIFEVNNVENLTPPARKIQDKLFLSSYVVHE